MKTQAKKPVVKKPVVKKPAAKDKKNQAALDRAAALKRADEERARQAKELEEFQSKQAEKKADFIRLRTLIHDGITFVSDENGIIGTEIARLYLVSTQAKRVMFEEINALPLDKAIERLNQAYVAILDDDMKESFKKNIQNVTTPSNVGKRFTLSNHVGKIGRDNKKGIYIDISNVDNSHKAKGGKVQGAANKSKSKSGKTPDLIESNIVPQVPVDTNKPNSKLDTNLSPDKQNLPTGTADRKRNMASLIVQIIDTYSIDEIEEIIMQLDEHVTKNRIILKSVVNG